MLDLVACLSTYEDIIVSFSELNLHPNIFKAITACGYTHPTPIQARSIPDILKGKDLVASAQTGTGKTAAFVLPALHHLSLKKPVPKQTRILILTPTRELATQITTAASKYGKFLRFNIVSLVGGMPYHRQIRDLSHGADIIVATPGRLMDHMSNGRVNLSGIEMLVLDEADRMLDMGFIQDIRNIANQTPGSRQTLLFSATVNDKLAHVIRHLLKNPLRINLSNGKVAPTKIKQELYIADNAPHKSRMLRHLLQEQNIFKAIIFLATKLNADKLARELRDQGYSAAALHGNLRQNIRNRTIKDLRTGKIQLLVATDVAARGIDIGDISHVINFDLPKFCEDYVHRIGRTGRAEKTGTAISFVQRSDMQHLRRIERYLGERLPLIKLKGAEPINDFDLSILNISSQKRPFNKRAQVTSKPFTLSPSARGTSSERSKHASTNKRSSTRHNLTDYSVARKRGTSERNNSQHRHAMPRMKVYRSNTIDRENEVK
jgi:superfamily II DNA/RNA helicase